MSIGKLAVVTVLLGGIACDAQSRIILKSGTVTFTAETQGFRYSFAMGGKTVGPADTTAGLLLAGASVSVKPEGNCIPSRCVLLGTTALGDRLRLTVTLDAHHA